MLTDLEFVLRRLHNVITGDKPSNEQLIIVQELINQWAEEISFKLDEED